jgi:eukaryotic-like serine/threonine-protein kinase
MRLCKKCGEEFAEEADYCPHDGTALVAQESLVGSLLAGQFEVRELCGQGAMGQVYRAWQRNTEREVAVKVLRRKLLKDPTIVRRFHREAKAAARLNHTNIISVYMVGDTDDGLPFLVMPYLRGEDLEQACIRSGPMDPQRAVYIAAQIASALNEAHRHNVVHRDLKPENILLTDKHGDPDFAIVLDFGIAKILEAQDESRLTKTGAIFGTPHFLSPEQASGNPIDHRTDLYALGVILYRMATGELPFDGKSGVEVLVKHLKQKAPPPRKVNPGISRALEAVINKAMAKDPDARWDSAAAFHDALCALPAGQIVGQKAGRSLSLPPTETPLSTANPPTTARAAAAALPATSPTTWLSSHKIGGGWRVHLIAAPLVLLLGITTGIAVRQIDRATRVPSKVDIRTERPRPKPLPTAIPKEPKISPSIAPPTSPPAKKIRKTKRAPKKKRTRKRRRKNASKPKPRPTKATSSTAMPAPKGTTEIYDLVE